MSEKLAADEQMVPFKGRNRLKQYLPAKPKTWGYKILVLAGSDGVPHNFEIYTGRVVQPPELPDVGASGNVVLRLAQPIPVQQNYKLFFGNWFTSVPLILTLAQQGINCAGTVRSNRLPGVNLKCDAELKRTGRGSFEEKMAMVGETNLHAVKWYDNRSVSLLSNYIGAHPVTEVDRSKKWYHRLMFHFVDMTVVTAWLLYKRDCSSAGMRKAESMKLYTFKSYTAESLCKCGKNLERKRGRPSTTIAGEFEEKRRRGPATPILVPDVRLDATVHWMVMDEKKGRCKMYGGVWVVLALLALTPVVPRAQACPRSCNCYQASEVHCTFRSLLTIPPGLPAHTRRINLGFNSISRIQESSLAGLKRLELLMLHSNDIHHLPDALFRDMKSLQILKLSYNKLREISSSLTFSGLTSLLRLYLDHNLLQHIHPRALLQLPSLRLLRLQGNRLHQLHPNTLCTLSLLNTYYFSTLRHLDLSNNSLTTLPSETLQTAPLLETLVLQANPWSCDCRMNWFLTWSRVRPDIMKCPTSPLCPVCSSLNGLEGQAMLEQTELPCTSPVITSPGGDTPSETELGEIQPTESFQEPVGTVSLGLSDHQENRVDLTCYITRSADSQDISPPPDLSLSASSPIALALSVSLECPVERESYESLWRILAYYSETAVHLEREIMLSKHPVLAYRYRQAAEAEGYYNTGVKASVQARPQWLLQPAIGIQLNRAQSNRHKVSLVYSTRVSARPDPTVYPSSSSPHPWVLISANRSTTALAATAGTMVELSCPIRGSGNPKVEWILPDGSKLTSPSSSQDGRLRASVSGLVLQKVRLSDAGVYYCVAKAGKDTDVLPLRLAVEESSVPPSGEQVGPPVTGTVGQPVRLSCKASGSPAPGMSWVLPDGNIIWSGLAVSGRLTVQSNGTLTLRQPSLRDAGHYRCVAVNQYGSASLSMQLEMNPHPLSLRTSFPREPQSASGRSTKIRAPLFNQVEEGSGDEEDAEEKTFIVNRKHPRPLQPPQKRRYPNGKPIRRGPLREGRRGGGGGPLSSSDHRRNRYDNRHRVTANKQRIDPQKWADILAKIRQKTALSNNSQPITAGRTTAEPATRGTERQGGGGGAQRSKAQGSETEGSSDDNAELQEENLQPVYHLHTRPQTSTDADTQIGSTEKQTNLEDETHTHTQKGPEMERTTDSETQIVPVTSKPVSGTNEIVPQPAEEEGQEAKPTSSRARPQKPHFGLFPNLVPNSRPQSPWNSRRRIGQRRRVINRPRGRPLSPPQPLPDPVNPRSQSVTPDTSTNQMNLLLLAKTTKSPATLLTHSEYIKTLNTSTDAMTVNPLSPSVSITPGIPISESDFPSLTPSSPSSFPPSYTNTLTDTMTHLVNIPDALVSTTFNGRASSHSDIVTTHPPLKAGTHKAHGTETHTALGKHDDRPPGKDPEGNLSGLRTSSRETPSLSQVDPRGKPVSGAPNQSRPSTDWKNPGVNFIPDSHSSRPHRPPSPSLPAAPGAPVVRSRPKIADPHIRTVSFPAESVARLACEAQGEPKPSITWTKVATGAVMSIHSRAQRFEVLPNGTLVIQNVQLQDRGTYICSAHSFLGRDRSLTTLEVWTRPPRMQLASYREATIHQGGEVHLECQANGVPTPLLSWVLPDRSVLTSSVNSSNRITMDTNGTLHISVTLPSDRGIYRCVASNSAGAASSSVRVHVSSLPPVIHQPREEHLLLAPGRPLYAHCSARGAPPPTLRWRIPDGTLVRPSQFLHGNLFVLPNGTLHIRKVGPKDSGNYECTSSNAVGADKRTVRVEVKEETEGERRVGVAKNEGAATEKLSPSSSVQKEITLSSPSNPSKPLDSARFSPPSPSDTSKTLPLTPSISHSSSSPHQHNFAKINKTDTTSPPHITNMNTKPSSLPSNNNIVPPGYVNNTRVTVSSSSDRGRPSAVLHSSPVSPFSKARIVSSSPSVTTASYGEKLQLHCSVSGNPSPIIIWRTPNRKLVDMHFSFDRRLKVHPNGTLSVQDVTERDVGDYLCIARNKVGDDYRLLRVSVVSKPAKIEPKQPLNHMVSFGKPLKVDCLASGLPDPAVHWSLPDGTMVNSVLQGEDRGGRARRLTVFDNGTLLVPAVGMGEEGVYTCYAENQGGQDTMKVKVKVMMTSPPTFTDNGSYQVIKVRQGATATIRCRATGNPTPTVTWFSPTRRLIPLSPRFPSERVAVASDGTLEVRLLQQMDTGNYTCRASNSAGEKTKVVGLELEVPNHGLVGGRGWSSNGAGSDHNNKAGGNLYGFNRAVTSKISSNDSSNNGYSDNNGRIRNAVAATSGFNPALRSESRHGSNRPVSGVTTQLGSVISIGANGAGNIGVKADNTGINRNSPGVISRVNPVEGGAGEKSPGTSNNEVGKANTSGDNGSVGAVSRTLLTSSGAGAGVSARARSNTGVSNDNSRNSGGVSSTGTRAANNPANRVVGVVTTKQRVVKGQTVLLPCPSHGSPPLTWLLPGNGVLPAPYYGSRLTVYRNGSLELRGVRMSDSGTLICVVRGEGGETRIQVELEVFERQEEARKRESSVEKLGENRPLSSVGSHSGAPLASSQLRPEISHQGIPVTQKPLHLGPSVLTAPHSVGPPPSTGPQVSTKTASLVSIINGETLRLPCPGHFQGSLSWTLPSSKVVSRGESGDSGRYSVQDDGTLVVQQASVFDRGTYMCRSTSPTSVSVVTVPVIVIAYPPRITTGPSPVTYTRPGVAVELPCLTTATPRATITWETPDLIQLRVMGQARIYGNHYLSPQGSLVIQNPTSRDTGFYRCTAKNVVGVDTKATYLHVI
ncbi:matrix-remodeling-associated protein 5-like [Aulostomus maculatus]